MISQDDMDQLEISTAQELERLFGARKKYKSSENRDAADFVSHVERSIIFIVKKIFNEQWLCQMATTHPLSAIVFVNNVHTEPEDDKFLHEVNNIIQMSDAYKILQTKHFKKCDRFLNLDQVTEQHLRALTVFDIISSQEGYAEKGPLLIRSQFKTAAGDFQTIRQVWEVRDEARRRLVRQALIDHDFKTRVAANSIGCKSDGAMAGNVRVLFGTSDYKRETIEPVIRAWEAQKFHPFQPVIDALVELKTLPKVEEQIQEFYPVLIKRAAEKCHFVKVRMAESLGISEKTITSFLSSLNLEEWYVDSHQEFLHRICEKVDYNYSQVATLLNVDVRYVTQQITNYGIEKPDGKVRTPVIWPT